MAVKQGHGKRPGSVRERADRPGYEARVRLPNGTRPSRYFQTKREAWTWINQKLVESAQSLYVVDDTRKTGDVLRQWLEDVTPKTLKPNSLYNYRLCVGYVLPWIGGIKLKDLKRPHIERMFAGLERGDDKKQTEDAIEQYCQQVIVREHLEHLPAKYRIVLILRYLQDRTYEEMADILTLPIGTIKTHLFRARNLLKQHLLA